MSCSPTEAAILPKNQSAALVWNWGGEHYDKISSQIADAIDHCVDRLAPGKSDQVLDIATGTGWTARRIAERGAEVNAVDICSTALKTARRLATNHQINFQLGNAEALPFGSSSFDAVVSTL
ncbi:MAG TPA: hypothetical protein DDW52_23420 [Planctomycetaceae bacterium]|nr:hypothetical protein [Planctomycetaceae bacterium]